MRYSDINYLKTRGDKKLAELDWCLRMILAAFCGGIIGFERKSKAKSAGIRTHALIAIGAAMAMVVSKYGFFDLLSITHSNWGLDPSRIAAQVVSGIGFLGAGTIFISRNSNIINGLTTAAGIWVTGAIGMAYGSGLYGVGAVGTIFVIIAEILGKYFDQFAAKLGKNVSWFIEIDGNIEQLEAVVQQLNQYFVRPVDYSIYSYNEKVISFRIFGKLKSSVKTDEIFNLLIAMDRVKSADLE